MRCRLPVACLAVLAVTPPSSGASDSDRVFTLQIDGGNAYVFSEESRRVDVGPVKEPGEGISPHRMFLRVDPLTTAVTKPDGFELQASPSANAWPVSGFEIWICPDGPCPSTSALHVSPDDGIARCEPCAPAKRTVEQIGHRAVDNMSYLPDLLALHEGYGLPREWPALLDGRVVLREGKLVLVDTFDCVKLKGSVRGRHAVANGIAGIHYAVTYRTFVNVLFKRGEITGGLRLEPKLDSRGIIARLGMPDAREGGEGYAKLKVGSELKDFQQFYKLLPDLPVEKRLKALFQPESVQHSPGQACGSARFGGPRPGPVVPPH